MTKHEKALFQMIDLLMRSLSKATPLRNQNLVQVSFLFLAVLSVPLGFKQATGIDERGIAFFALLINQNGNFYKFLRFVLKRRPAGREN